MATEYIIFKIDRNIKDENGYDFTTIANENALNRCEVYGACERIMTARSKDECTGAMEALRKTANIEDEYTYIVKQTKGKRYGT